MTITSIAHFTQLQHYVHFHHMKKIMYPQSKGTTLSIHMTAKTMRLSILENQKRTLAERTKEHTRAVRAADTRRYETSDHYWKYNHDFDWVNKIIINYEANTTTRKVKETIHSLSNNNHINGILINQ